VSILEYFVYLIFSRDKHYYDPCYNFFLDFLPLLQDIGGNLFVQSLSFVRLSNHGNYVVMTLRHKLANNNAPTSGATLNEGNVGSILGDSDIIYTDIDIKRILREIEPDKDKSHLETKIEVLVNRVTSLEKIVKELSDT